MAGKRKAPPAFIAAGRAALRGVNARRHLMPKCRAMSKTTGQQCRQFPMENGLCYYHGGRTPKGKDWHRTQWPDKAAPDAIAKMENKLRMQDRSGKARQKRLAKMTEEERAAFDKWHRDRPLGTPAQRDAKRLVSKQNKEARARFLEPAPLRPVDPETAARQARIAELRAQLAALRNDAPGEQKPAPGDDPDGLTLGGIFG